MLALAISAMAVPNEPAQVAVDFLDKVRAGKLNLDPGGDTAITDNTDASKRREIARRLQRTASDLSNGTLEAGQAKIDENLAAVLVRKVGGFDPSRLRVFAVALVKRGELWLPAPVLVSFENTGVGYAPGLRKRLDAMESWMLDQQTLELDTIQQQANQRMQQAITAVLPLHELLQLGPDAAALRFLKACSTQQLPVMLGLLGGLHSVLPDDWYKRLQAAETAAATPLTVKRPWRLLVAPEVLRTVVHQESDNRSAAISIACLDPIAPPNNVSLPQPELIHLNLSKSPDDPWQVDPPDGFFLTEKSPPDQDDAHDQDDKVLARYPSMLRKSIPLQPQATAAAAVKAMEQGLQAPTLEPLIALLDLETDSKAARLRCSQAAKDWGALHDRSTVRNPLPLGVFETDTVAAASFQYFSVREPDRLDVHVFFFEKKSSGWQWVAGLQTNDRAQGNLLAAKTWADGEPKRRSDTWRKNSLSNSTHVAAITAGNAPTEADARTLVESWLAATRAGNVVDALALTAWLDPEKSPARVLRNLGYEVNGARRAKATASIAAVVRGNTWTGVLVHASSTDKPSHPLYPVIHTSKGPKILIEIDWFANAERGREFLNNTSMSHLRNYASDELTDELRDLFKKAAESTAP